MSRPVRLAVVLATEPAACGICSQQPQAYVLVEIYRDGTQAENGAGCCAACAAKVGHPAALLAAVAALERELLRVDDLEDRTGKDTRREMAHLRALIAAGKVAGPPVPAAPQGIRAGTDAMRVRAPAFAPVPA